ncbi:MAG: hypothetical protein IJ877_01320 [Candidatus Gastranaerophilales bacterium]|nr:hypothetical protein [Candidatus Gastranaerophilales bacterium]
MKIPKISFSVLNFSAKKSYSQIFLVFYSKLLCYFYYILNSKEQKIIVLTVNPDTIETRFNNPVFKIQRYLAYNLSGDIELF